MYRLRGDSDLLRLSSFILSLGVYFLVSLKLKNEEWILETEVLAALGIGLIIGDLNSLGLYQSLLKDTGTFPSSRFLTYRTPFFLFITSILFLSKFSILWYYFIIGGLVSLLFPQGRVSESSAFVSIVLYGSWVKIVLGLLFYFLIISTEVRIILLMGIMLSQYIISLPYHFRLISKDIVLKDTNIFKYQFGALLINTPILIYTSLGIYFYQMFHGRTGISNYYFYDRLYRGLGSTVLALQSKTHSVVSSLSGDELFAEIKFNILKYSFTGLVVAVVFVACSPFFNIYLGLDFGRDVSVIVSIMILIGVPSMYLSNLLGIQYFMSAQRFKVMLISIFVTLITFVLLVYFNRNIHELILIPEIVITIVLFIFFLYDLLSKDKR
jgi:hypothetical protein